MSKVQKTHLPLWLIWCPDWDETVEDALRIHEWDAESAAEAWGNQCEDEGHLVNDWLLVKVRQEGTTDCRQFKVRGEVEVHYVATPADGE